MNVEKKMDGTFPPLLSSSSTSLLQSLLHLCTLVSSMEKLPLVQAKNISTMIRRIKTLSSLLEEIQDTNTKSLPPSSILCLTELLSVVQRTKLVIAACKEGSSLWSLIQTEHISKQFHALVKEMGRALDILPLSLLNITIDMREQVELLHRQAKRAELGKQDDEREMQRRDELLQLMDSNNDNKSKNKGSGCVDVTKLKDILSSSTIGLTTQMDFEGEIIKLEAEAQRQAGTGGLIVVSNINNLISLVNYAKNIIFVNEQKQKETKSMQNQSSSSSHSQGSLPSVPDEFRCPISLDLMRDPVIVSSGHTYDRNSIAQWINSGHHTCPKSGQRLIHMALIPNYALKSLVHQWCHDNKIPFIDSANDKCNDAPVAVDHISASKAARDAVKMTAEFLVGKLATGSQEIQRQAAYELRLLAKTGMDSRRMIAEAGAIPFLVILLQSTDSRIQENAVTALLNLSIFDNNKFLIVSAGAVESIIGVLELGKTMEARENAAATIFSLSIIDECKVSIGAHPRAIISLVGLLTEGTTTGKRDAATALFNLAVYNANKPIIAVSGAIPLLIQLLMDDKAGITDDALALLAILLSSSQGMEETRKSKVLVPLLIDLLRFGSPKGKENAITLLLGLCKDGGEEVAGRLLMNPRSIPSLQSLAAHGSLKARRKADALLRLLNRCCSHSHSNADFFTINYLRSF